MKLQVTSLFGVLLLAGVSDAKSVFATNCRKDNGGSKEKCIFNSGDLKLEEGGSIEIAVKEGGRIITCSHNANLGDLAWYAECDGDARDANFIKRMDLDGNEYVFGSIHVGSDICQVAPNAAGEGEIECTPEDEFPDELESLEAPNEDDGTRNLRSVPSSSFNLQSTTSSIRGSASRIDLGFGDSGRRLYDDTGSNLDIMVVWTNMAECKQSGLSEGCLLTATTEINMRGLVDLAVAETNTAYTNSGINTQLRLVHAYRDPDYVETGFSSILTSLQSTTDGQLDSVHAKRTLYSADMVAMLVGIGGSCGIAYVGPNSRYMFSVTAYRCATGNYSFGHEIGHNMGMFHDRGTQNTCGADGDYNYGWRDPKSEFRSILAYDCRTGECDNLPTNGCSRVQRFSNTVNLYNGKAMGDANTNNARAMNKVIAAVAAYYPAMNCQNNGDCDDNDAGTVDTCNTANGACVFTPFTAPITAAPTKSPTTAAPITDAPTKSPSTGAPITGAPTKSPTTAAPTDAPTNLPTTVPTSSPTMAPTSSPTMAPTNSPTAAPTDVPTNLPTTVPTSSPTMAPTSSPTMAPTNSPTTVPTEEPTFVTAAPILGFFLDLVSSFFTGLVNLFTNLFGR